MNKKNLLLVLFINFIIVGLIFIFTEIVIISPKANVWKWTKYCDNKNLSELEFSNRPLNKVNAEKIAEILYKDWQKSNQIRFSQYWDTQSIDMGYCAGLEKDNISRTSGSEIRWCMSGDDSRLTGLCPPSAYINDDDEYADSIKNDYFNIISNLNRLQMKFKYHLYGDEAFGDRSMYISLHGGGSVPAEFNDQQWENQVNLYRPKHGLYIAPRAPEDDWNMWFKPYMIYFYDELIRSSIAVMGVNPDKIYITGYSAGGDGLYRIAPLLCDHFASAAMMAGHPGDISPLSLYNLPYAIWMGENDEAFSRNENAVNWGFMLDSLQRITSPDKYIHSLNIVEGKGHWMDRADTAAIDWMAGFVRNPYPERIVWKNDNDIKPEYFYWLSLGDKEVRKESMVIVSREDNTFIVEQCNVPSLTIHLNDNIADLNRPLKVIYDNKIIFNGKVKRTSKNIFESIYHRGDKRYIFCSKIDLTIPQ